MKFITFALFMIIAPSTQASVDVQSFTGNFKVGTCSLSNAETATISLTNESLVVKFDNDNAARAEFFLRSTDEEFATIKVTEESFSLSNEFSVKVNEGMYLPVIKTRIARSASGNRVRLNTLHYETNMASECVLYRK